MPLLDKLPDDLEDADALITRRGKASAKKEMWRSTYEEAYRFAMPMRETFNWTTPGQQKNNRLFDSTLQECTFIAVNTLIATVFPSWMRWGELAPGGAIPKGNIPHAIVQGLQESTEIFFDFLDASNFSTAINEVAQDLMVGTGSLQFDEGDDDMPFVFASVPSSAIEIEEGPMGSVETTWFARKVKARDLVRTYPGLDEFDLPTSLKDKIREKPDEDIDLVQGYVYHPGTKSYYGVVIDVALKVILWRYNFEYSCPMIVARANKAAGETYGRGRVLLALSDAKTLDKMVEFMLRHSALQIGGVFTGVSDGVMNPFTATMTPNVIIPVASNDRGNPSLQSLDIGGNFAIGDKMVSDLRDKVRRVMLGPQRDLDSPVVSASQALINDRELLQARGGESGRIQTELLNKIIHRGVYILQRRGLIPEFKIDGRAVKVKFTSPFAKSQNTEDLMALERVIVTLSSLGPNTAQGALEAGLKVSDVADWTARKAGLDMKLVNSPEERKKIMEDAAAAAAQALEAAQAGEMQDVPGIG